MRLFLVRNVKKYTTIFFDLDDTLLDFHASETNAIKKVLKKYNLPFDTETVALYSKINLSYWKRFENGEIKKSDIFVNRFITFLEKLGEERDAQSMCEDYFAMLSLEHPFVEGAFEVLKTVKERGYKICITTNGVSSTQYRRIKESGIEDIADCIVVSEEVGFQKPDKRYFEFAMEKCGESDASRILVVGDSQSSDILGALNSSMDSCWFNPKHSESVYKVNYEIDDIEKLLDII